MFGLSDPEGLLQLKLFYNSMIFLTGDKKIHATNHIATGEKISAHFSSRATVHHSVSVTTPQQQQCGQENC